MRNTTDKYVLDIEWDDTARPDLPTLIGPFGDHEEAEAWAATNVPNGTTVIRPLARPYMCARIIA